MITNIHTASRKIPFILVGF